MTTIRDFWERLRTGIQRTPWLTLQVFLMFVVALLFLVLIIWSEPISRIMLPVTPSLSANSTLPTPAAGTTTEIPLEYRQNALQTNINVIGAGLMVLIIVVGTLTHLAYRRKKIRANRV